MIGPVLFVTVFLLEGWLRADYDPMRMYASELSLGPRGWVQIVNFLVLGIVLLVFARGTADVFREGKASKSGPIILALIGICILASGPFVTDPSTIFPGQVTWHGTVHSILGAIGFTFMLLSCFVLFRRFRGDPKWRAFAGWTLAAGLVFIVAIVLLKAGQVLLSVGGIAIGDLVGLFQRIALITYLGWVLFLRSDLKDKLFDDNDGDDGMDDDSAASSIVTSLDTESRELGTKRVFRVPMVFIPLLCPIIGGATPLLGVCLSERADSVFSEAASFRLTVVYTSPTRAREAALARGW